jgi:AmmeMemoRadiSam system protein A
MLGEEDRAQLLEIARQGITAAALGRAYEPPSDLPPSLTAPGAAFVTCKTRDGRLRGCIGLIVTSQALAHTVAEMAEAASQRDPRFAPIMPDEVPGIRIEISVLSPPAPISAEEVEVGIHGLIVEKGPARGLLLPQVPVEQRWDRATFLAQTCQKAGLPRDAWRDPTARLLGFTAEVFGEE